MIDTKHNQRGVTAIGWLVILGLIAFFALLALKLFPIYMEKMKVDSALTYVSNQPGIGDKSKRDIIDAMVKNLDINGISHISESTFKKYGKVGYDKKKNKVIAMKYEIRNSFFGDLDIVMNYENSVVLKK